MANYNFEGIKGLTVKDRATWENNNRAFLNSLGYFNLDEDTKTQSFKRVMFTNKFKNNPEWKTTLSKLPTDSLESLYNRIDDEEASKPLSETSSYQSLKEEIGAKYESNKFDNGTYKSATKQELEEFDNVMSELSDRYRRFKGTDKLPSTLSDASKLKLLTELKADIATIGTEAALTKMQRKIDTEASENQHWAEKYYNGFVGAGAQTAGGIINFVGSISSTLSAITGLDRLFGENSKDNYFENIWDRAINNPISRYGQKVAEQGSFIVEDDPDKAYNRYEILRTPEEMESLWSNVFSVNTVPELFQQGGPTIASMIEGWGLERTAHSLITTIKTAKAVNYANKLRNGQAATDALVLQLENLSNIQRRFNAYGVPIFTSMGEALQNAQETYDNVIDEGKNLLADKYKEEYEINEEVNKRLKEELSNSPLKPLGETGGYTVGFDQIKKRIEEEVRAEFGARESEKNTDYAKVEDNALKAALSTFMLDSTIEGFAHEILMSNMYVKNVREAIKRSSVGKLFDPGKFAIVGDKVIAKKPTALQQMFNISKEFLGEGATEYAQTIVDKFSTAGALNNLESYLYHKYDSDSFSGMADELARNIGAGFKAAGEAAVDNEAILSGIYGSLSQAIGTVNVNSILDFKNTKWKNTSTFEKINNIWRLPMLDAYYKGKEELTANEHSARALNEWLSMGNNRDRVISINGSISWAREMQEKMDSGDEFGFRNSRLGKFVQDYFMLSQLKGTKYYDDFMQNLDYIMNAAEGSTEAENIEKYSGGRTLEQVQNDVRKMQEVMEQIESASEDLEKTLGNSVPQAVKESFIFGKLSINDWDKRSAQLEKELKLSDDTPISEETALTPEQTHHIARYGSLVGPKKYDKAIEELNEKKKTLQEKESRTKEENKELASIDKAIQNLEKSKKLATDFYEEHIRKGLDPNVVLSERQIMELDPEERFRMLNPKNREFYSAEQQKIIDNVVAQGTLSTSDFMNKVEDAARIASVRNEFTSQYMEALKNPSIMNTLDGFLRVSKRASDLKKSYKEIDKIQDYNEFVSAVERVLYTEDSFGKSLLQQVLKDNENFKRFIDGHNQAVRLSRMLEKSEEFKDLSDADKGLVTAMSKYLYNQGVDVTNPEAVMNALLDSDENNGQSKLSQYIEGINKLLPKGVKPISMDNIKSVADSFRSALISLNKNDELKNLRNPRESSRGAVRPNTPKGDNPNKDNNNLGNGEGNNEITSGIGNTLAGDALNNISDKDILETVNDKVLNAAGNLINAVREFAKGHAHYSFSDAEIQRAIKIIEDILKKNCRSDITPSEFLNKIAAQSRLLNASGKEANEITGHLLFGGVLMLDSTGNIKPKEPKKTAAVLSRNRYSFLLPKILEVGTGFLSTKFKEWGVYDYLRNHTFNESQGTTAQVSYITLSDITEGVITEMGERYSNETHLPVIAVIQDSNGPIKIGSESYQPIGVLPRTSDNPFVETIRKAAIEQGPNTSLTVNGRKITSTIVSSESSLNVSKSSETDTDISQVILNDIKENSPEDQAVLDNPTAGIAEKRSVIRKYVEKIKSRLRISQRRNVNDLCYELDGSLYYITTKRIEKTKSVRNGKTFLEQETPQDKVNFNSRTSLFVGYLNSFIRENWDNLAALKNNPERLKLLANRLNNALYFSVEGRDNFRYDIHEESNGNLSVDLYVGREKLGTIIDGTTGISLTTEEAANILTNLLFPVVNGERSVRPSLNWQVDKKFGSYKEHIDEVLQDDILNFPLKTLEKPIGVLLSTPEALVGVVPAEPQETVVNEDNARSPESPTEEEDRQRAFNEAKTETDLAKAREILKQIREDSKSFTRTEKFYTNSVQKVFARVTSVIKAVSNSTRYANEDSNTVNPATNIGTGIDSFVRAFFADELVYNSETGVYSAKSKDGTTKDLSEVFPNASERQLQSLARQLHEFKGRLELHRGMEFDSSEIVVMGSLKVGTEDGREGTLSVAGTLDILAVDKYGNFHIYDIKTFAGAEIDPAKRTAYARQLSLYKKFLEDKYHINIASINLLPIHVNYTRANSRNVYSLNEVEDVQDPNRSQLLLNGKPFKMAKPELATEMLLDPVDIDIRYELLTEEEKETVKFATVMDDSKTLGEGPSSKITTLEVPQTKEDYPTQVVGGVQPSEEEHLLFESLSSEDQEKVKEYFSEYNPEEDIDIIKEEFNDLSPDLQKQILECS